MEEEDVTDLSICISLYITQCNITNNSAMRKQTLLPFATTWMDLEGIMQSEIHLTRKRNAVWYHSLLLLFSCWVMSNHLWLHGRQCSRPPCPSLPAGVCPSSCPLNWWCLPAVPSSVTFFSFCLQFFPASGSFPMGWLFTSDGWSIGTSASASVLPVNIPMNIDSL